MNQNKPLIHIIISTMGCALLFFLILFLTLAVQAKGNGTEYGTVSISFNEYGEMNTEIFLLSFCIFIVAMGMVVGNKLIKSEE